MLQNFSFRVRSSSWSLTRTMGALLPPKRTTSLHTGPDWNCEYGCIHRQSYSLCTLVFSGPSRSWFGELACGLRRCLQNCFDFTQKNPPEPLIQQHFLWEAKGKKRKSWWLREPTVEFCTEDTSLGKAGWISFWIVALVYFGRKGRVSNSHPYKRTFPPSVLSKGKLPYVTHPSL